MLRRHPGQGDVVRPGGPVFGNVRRCRIHRRGGGLPFRNRHFDGAGIGYPVRGREIQEVGVARAQGLDPHSLRSERLERRPIDGPVIEDLGPEDIGGQCRRQPRPHRDRERHQALLPDREGDLERQFVPGQPLDRKRAGCCLGLDVEPEARRDVGTRVGERGFRHRSRCGERVDTALPLRVGRRADRLLRTGRDGQQQKGGQNDEMRIHEPSLNIGGKAGRDVSLPSIRSGGLAKQSRARPNGLTSGLTSYATTRMG